MLFLESSRTIIRNLKDEDLDDFVSYRSDPEVARYQGYEIFNKKKAFEFIVSQKERSLDLSGKWMQLAIVEKESLKLIGDCAVRLKDNDLKTAEVGCTISPFYQQKGFAGEALKILVNYLLKEEGLKKITAVIDAENKASAKLMASLGFLKEGEEIVKFKGQWCKEFNYVFQKAQND
jgi:[ribosomal protein S5]-alanine N-acetyltransferase